MTARERIRRRLVRFYDGTFGRPGHRLLEQYSLERSRQIDLAVGHVEATVALYSTIRFRLPLPPMRGWAISPEFACQLVREILSSQPKTVLELGSGVSTLVCGYALEALGSGNVLSLEHEEEWHRLSSRYIEEHQLGDVAKIVYAPLKDVVIGDETFPWYDCSQLPRGQLFEMLVIDGPPGRLHPMARYPALPVLMKILTPDAVIILHDAKRPAERAISERWKREYGPFIVESPVTKKGMLIFRRQTEAVRNHPIQDSICPVSLKSAPPKRRS